MAQTLEDRQKVLRDLEDIHNSVAAAIEKVARTQLETEGDNPEMADALSDCLSSLSETAEKMQGLISDFGMETARRQNEGEL